MELDRDNLVMNLQKRKLQIVFTKANGEMRGMFCTLREDCIPKSRAKSKKKPSDNEFLISVWDLEKNGWRSFNCNKVAAVLQMEEDDATSVET